MPFRNFIAAAALAGALLAGQSVAAEPVSFDDGRLTLQLPSGFVRVAPELFDGSAALVPVLEGSASRAVVAVYREGRGEDAATIVIGRVNRPLEIGPTLRANASSAVASHFRGELSLEVAVDRAAIAGPPGPVRLEVRSETQLEGNPRVVRFAFLPAGEVHYVLAMSYPLRREQELTPELKATVEGAAIETERGHSPRRFVLRLAFFGAIGVAAVVLLRLWRGRAAGTGEPRA